MIEFTSIRNAPQPGPAPVFRSVRAAAAEERAAPAAADRAGAGRPARVTARFDTDAPEPGSGPSRAG